MGVMLSVMAMCADSVSGCVIDYVDWFEVVGCNSDGYDGWLRGMLAERRDIIGVGGRGSMD